MEAILISNNALHLKVRDEKCDKGGVLEMNKLIYFETNIKT